MQSQHTGPPYMIYSSTVKGYSLMVMRICCILSSSERKLSSISFCDWQTACQPHQSFVGLQFKDLWLCTVQQEWHPWAKLTVKVPVTAEHSNKKILHLKLFI